jgi:hypothetical protein
MGVKRGLKEVVVKRTIPDPAEIQTLIIHLVPRHIQFPGFYSCFLDIRFLVVSKY